MVVDHEAYDLDLQDVVTRGGKFLFLYKRPGKRVIVNDFGHFMIAPNSIEASIQQSAGGTRSQGLPQHCIRCRLAWGSQQLSLILMFVPSMCNHPL